MCGRDVAIVYCVGVLWAYLAMACLLPSWWWLGRMRKIPPSRPADLVLSRGYGNVNS